MSKCRQQGSALIIVILAVSVLAVVSVMLSEKIQYSVKHLENSRYLAQAKWYGLAVEELVLNKAAAGQGFTELLSADNGKGIFEIDQGIARYSIHDLRACFNLNSLAEIVPERGGQGFTSPRIDALRTILIASSLGSANIETFLQRAYDWIDPDSVIVASLGAEDEYYRSKTIPYITNNGVFVDFSELYLLDITSADLSGLSERLCMLPYGMGNKINANTVMFPEVLSAATNGQISLADASKVIAEKDIMHNHDDLKRVIGISNSTVTNLNDVIFDSDVIRVDINVTYNSAQFFMSSYIRADNNDYRVYRRSLTKANG